MVWGLVVGATLVVGCGDDDGSGDADSVNGGTAGTGGVNATAGVGASKGGTAGKSGGQAGSSAGEAGGPSAGAGGSSAIGGAGGGGGDEGFAPITRVADSVISAVHDLRGLTYGKSGKIWGSGHVGVDAKSVDRELAVVRLNADGTLDESFGDEGVVTLNLVERTTRTDSVWVNAGAGGAGGGGGAGGEGGSEQVPVEVVVNDGDEQSIGLVELASGDLVVQANIRDASGKGMDVALVKLDADGELVESFGDDGVLRVDLGWTDDDQAAAWTSATGPSDTAWGIALDDSGDEEKIVLTAFGPAARGQTTGNPAVQRTDNDRYVVRLLASDGSIDPDFNGGKVYSVNSGGTFSDGARRAIVEEDGSIVSSGYTNYGEGLGNHVLLIRLKPDGTPDADFGFNIGIPGLLRSNPFLSDGGIAECYQVGKQSNGRYVTVGYGRATGQNLGSSFDWETTQEVDLVSFGFLPDRLDTAFGREGTLAIQSEGYALSSTEDRGRDLVVLPDDRVVLVGKFGPSPAVFVVTPDGEPDTTSGEDGRFTYSPLSGATSHFYATALSQDGSRIVAATSNHADGVLVAVLEVGE